MMKKSGTMKIKGKICLNYNNDDSARLVYDSLEIDNKNFVDSELKDNKILYEIDSDSLGSFLSTADDLIASEIVVEKIVEKTQK